MDAGLYGPDSVTWRVNREGVLVVGGGRALILQVAHPLVAAGVAEFSDYRQDPFGRLYRTLDLTTRIVFGDTPTAEEAARRLWGIHGRVNGRTREPGGRFPAGTAYDARDPELLMWVHATLVDTSILVYDLLVRRLEIGERREYYEEQKLLGEKFGIPRARQPASYAEFNEYFDEMLRGDSLGVTDTLRDVTDAVMRPPLPFVARPAIRAVNLATTGLLPARLRSELGLPWGPNRDRLLAASRTALRTVLPLVPRIARDFPQARRAQRRLRAARASGEGRSRVAA